MMRDTPAPATVRALANEFDQMIRWHLTSDEYDAAVAANRTETNPDVCHTHDFTDANVTMTAAFENVTDRTPDPSNDADTALINAAWDLWKEWSTGRYADAVNAAERQHQIDERRTLNSDGTVKP